MKTNCIEMNLKKTTLRNNNEMSLKTSVTGNAKQNLQGDSLMLLD